MTSKTPKKQKKTVKDIEKEILSASYDIEEMKKDISYITGTINILKKELEKESEKKELDDVILKKQIPALNNYTITRKNDNYFNGDFYQNEKLHKTHKLVSCTFREKIWRKKKWWERII